MSKLLYGYKILFTSIFVLISSSVLGSESDLCDLDQAREYYAQQKISDSKKILLSCLENESNFHEMLKIANVYFHLGLIERNKKNLSLAQEYFQNAIQKIPETIFRLEYAVSLEWDQKLNRALEQYDLILENESHNKFALHGKARVLRWQRRLHESNLLYIQLLNQDSNDINAKTGQGFIQLMDKNYKQAREIFEGVITVEPNNSEAKLGLKQLEGLKKHTLTYRSETRRKNSATLLKQQTIKHEINVRSEFNNRWTGIFSFSKQNVPLGGLELTPDGLLINREAEYKASAYSIYDGSKLKYLAGIDVKKTFNKEYEYQLTLQTEKLMKNTQRWYVGIRPSISQSKIDNTLFYGGHFKTLTPKLDLHNQVFYAVDSDHKKSSALVSTLIFRPTKKLLGSVGLSFSDNENGLEKIVHSTLAYQKTEKLNLGLNFVKRLESSSDELTLGMNYRF